MLILLKKHIETTDTYKLEYNPRLITFLEKAEKLCAEITATNLEKIFTQIVTLIPKYFQPTDRMYFGKLLYFLRTVPANHPFKKTADNFLSKLFPHAQNLENTQFSKGFITKRKRWKYRISGHANPDLDSLASVLLLSYILMQAPDYGRGRCAPTVLGHISEYDKLLIETLMNAPGFCDSFYTKVDTLGRKLSDVYTPAQECVILSPDDHLSRASELFNQLPLTHTFIPIIDYAGHYVQGMYCRNLMNYYTYIIENGWDIKELTIQHYIDWARMSQPELNKIAVPFDTICDNDFREHLREYSILPVIDGKYFSGLVHESQLEDSSLKIIPVDVKASTLVNYGANNMDFVLGYDHHNDPSATNYDNYGYNAPIGSAVALILKQLVTTMCGGISLPNNIAIVCLAAMVDDTDNWSPEKTTRDDKLVFKALLQSLPCESTWGIGTDITPDERMQKVIEKIRDLKEEITQQFYVSCLIKEYDNQGILRDRKTIGGIPIIQIKLNELNDSKFYFYQKNLTTYLNSLVEKDIPISIFIKSCQASGASVHTDDVYITSYSTKKLEVAVKFLKKKIKSCSGQELSPIVDQMSDHTYVLRYPAGTVFSRKKQFSENIMRELSERLNNIN